jgi:hypothetical protein
MSTAYQIVVCGSIVPDPLQTLEPVTSPTGPAVPERELSQLAAGGQTTSSAISSGLVWQHSTKRQRTGALQDAPRSPGIGCRASAFWSAAALRRFSPDAQESAPSLTRTAIVSKPFAPFRGRLKFYEHSLSNCRLRQHRSRSAADAGTHPQICDLRLPNYDLKKWKNEMKLPAVLNSLAGHNRRAGNVQIEVWSSAFTRFRGHLKAGLRTN